LSDKDKFAIPFPEMHPGHDVIQYMGRVVAKVKFKPVYVLIDQTSKMPEAAFVNKGELRDYMEGK